MSSPYTPEQRKRFLEIAKKRSKLMSDDDILNRPLPSLSADRRYVKGMLKKGGKKRTRSHKRTLKIKKRKTRSKKRTKINKRKSKH